ncbi:MAG: RluA family pseudouridine synthase [Methylacidiphilales bacterium]|nr:RluA family pseudouridine synthase [Candidatus Methylacidiphilales bacterium]
MRFRTTIIGADQSLRRLDHFIKSLLPRISTSLIQKLIRVKKITINGAKSKAHYRLQEGDLVMHPDMMESQSRGEQEYDVKVTQIWKSRILFENEDFIIINKPPGLAVHGGTQIKSTVLTELSRFYPETIKLHLAHRLDRLTSGCLCVAKNHLFLRHFHRLLLLSEVRKNYLAILNGVAPWSYITVNKKLQIIRSDVGGQKRSVVAEEGKDAESKFELLKTNQKYSLVRIAITHGRLHQIRAHAKYLALPILGDSWYDDSAPKHSPLFLHAESISFIDHHGSQHAFRCQPPSYFDSIM